MNREAVKVLAIIYGFNTGGAEKTVLDTLEWFHNHNEANIDYKVFSLQPNLGREYEVQITEHYLNVQFADENFNHNNTFTGVRWIKRRLLNMKLISKELKNFKPDIVHLHIAPIFSMALLPILLSKVKKRVYTLHSCPNTLKPEDFFLAKTALRCCGFYPICVTETLGKMAEKYYGVKKYSVIPNGICIEKFLSEDIKSKKEYRKQLNMDSQDFIVGCVARFSKIKNHIFLLEIFKIISESIPNSKLLLVGDGELKSELNQYAHDIGIEKRIIYAGNQKEVIPYYKAMDVFVLTSYFESSSLVTVEAQLLGIRCVVSSGIPEDVVISNNIVRIDLLKGADRFAQEIMRPCKQVMLHNTQKFSIESTMRQLENLYLQL